MLANGLVVLALTLGIAVFGSVSAVSQNPPKANSVTTSPGLTNVDIVRMIEAGISGNIIVLAIEESQTNFDTSMKALAALEERGAPKAVLDAILARRKAPIPRYLDSNWNQANSYHSPGWELGHVKVEDLSLSQTEAKVTGYPYAGQARAVVVKKIQPPAHPCGLDEGDIITAIINPGALWPEATIDDPSHEAGYKALAASVSTQTTSDYYRLASLCISSCLIGVIRDPDIPTPDDNGYRLCGRELHLPWGGRFPPDFWQIRGPSGETLAYQDLRTDFTYEPIVEITDIQASDRRYLDSAYFFPRLVGPWGTVVTADSKSRAAH